MISLVFGILLTLSLLLVSPVAAQRLQSEVAHDTALAPASTMVVTGCEAKDFDGAALPRAVSTEGDAVRCAATLSGVPYVMLVSEDGSLTIYQVEDAAHVSGHAGIMPLGVRNDTHTTALSGTDGDYTPLATDGTGKLGIRGTFAEDAAHSSADLGLFVLTVRNDTHTTALSGTDGDYTPLAVDSTGKLGIRGTFAEDAPHTSADLGLFVLCVRNDAGTALAGTDLDYIPCTTDSSGRLRIAAAPANSGVDIGDVDVTSVVPGTGATNLGKAEDAGHTTGDTMVPILAVRSDSDTALATTDLDYIPLSTNAAGHLRVAPVRAPAAATVDTPSTGITVDTDLEAAATNLRLLGWTARESAATAAVATVVLRHAVNAAGVCSGNAFAYIELGPDQSVQMSYASRGLAAASGVCADVLSGAVDINIFTVIESAP